MRAIILLFILLCSQIAAQSDIKSFEELKAEFTFSENNSNIIIFQSDNIIPRRHTALNLAGQALLGTGLAFIFAVPPLAATWAAAWSNGGNTGANALFGLTVASYMFGSAVGVRLVAKAQNPNLSLWKTYGFAAIGGGTGALLTGILASQYTTLPAVGVIIVLLSPVIASMIYASFIADWPQDNNDNLTSYKTTISHKDLIEQSKLFNIELIRIKL